MIMNKFNRYKKGSKGRTRTPRHGGRSAPASPDKGGVRGRASSGLEGALAMIAGLVLILVHHLQPLPFLYVPHPLLFLALSAIRWGARR